MSNYDHIIVGSGINSLVCASLLARRGDKVLLLERNDRLGGCIRSEELTVPGFIHDVMSSWHPLFVTSPAYAELKNELASFVTTVNPRRMIMSLEGRSARPAAPSHERDGAGGLSMGPNKLTVSEAAHLVIVDHSGGLHVGIDDRRSHELEAATLEVF